jgi:hypothetical protein
VRNSSGLDGKHIGEETDIYTWYELNRHLNIGAGFGDFEAADSSPPQPTRSFTAVPTSPSTSRMPDGRNNANPATPPACRAAALLACAQTLNYRDFGPHHGTEAKISKATGYPNEWPSIFPP